MPSRHACTILVHADRKDSLIEQDLLRLKGRQTAASCHTASPAHLLPYGMGMWCFLQGCGGVVRKDCSKQPDTLMTMPIITYHLVRSCTGI